MNRFHFRLQRVLEYRQLQEEWAKDAYLQAKAAGIRAVQELKHMEKRRECAQKTHTPSVEFMQNLELYLTKLEDEIEGQRSLISILRDEERNAHEEWLQARKNHKALDTLRQAAEAEWQKDAASQEQKQLDEWTNTRRAA